MCLSSISNDTCASTYVLYIFLFILVISPTQYRISQFQMRTAIFFSGHLPFLTRVLLYTYCAQFLRISLPICPTDYFKLILFFISCDLTSHTVEKFSKLPVPSTNYTTLFRSNFASDSSKVKIVL